MYAEFEPVRKHELARTFYGTGWENVEQVVLKDSTVFLRTQFHQTGIKFTRDEADSIGSALGGFLVQIRDECRGASPAGKPPYRVKADLE